MRGFDVIDSPLGPITLIGDDGRLCGLYFDQHRYAPAPGRWGERRPGAYPGVAEQLEGYFAGERTAFDVDLAMEGTPFQRTVWRALQDIPFGTTVSYAELASRVGRPGLARAVGAANGRNPISIVVPCHRVVGADGSLTGYGGGLDRKHALLALEQRLATG